MGCVMQVGNQGLNIGRNAVLAAGWPESVPATTVDRQCGSSQQSAHFAAQGVIAGAYDVVVAAGVEVMSTTPMGASVTPRQLPVRPQGHGALRRPPAASSRRASSAELIADKWGLSPRGPRRLRRPEPAAGRCRPPRRAASTTRSSRVGQAARQGDRQAHRDRRDRHRRRGHPPRHHGRVAGQAQARLQAGRQGHRRQLARRSPTAPPPC